jgi:hypothetical protein
MAHEILVMLRELEDDLGQCKCHGRNEIHFARLTHIGLRLFTGDKLPYEQDDSLSDASSDSDSTSPGRLKYGWMPFNRPSAHYTRCRT